MLIAIEGIDGSGKNTLARSLASELSKANRVKVVSSPGYERTECGKLIGRYLAGDFDLGTDNPYAVSLLFALDRQEGQPELRKWLDEGYVVIADRYAPSNAAYQAARSEDQDVADTVRNFVVELEYIKLKTIVPTHNIFVDTKTDVAQRLVSLKSKRVYTDETFDKYEADIGLMDRVSKQYLSLAACDEYGPWHRIETCVDGALRSPEDIAAEALQKLRL